MFKAFFKWNFLLIFAGAFLIPSFILGLIFAGYVNTDKIISDGIETDGYIISGSYYSDVEINEVPKYCIKYYFFDQYDIRHTGKTSTSYDYDEIMRLNNEDVIRIKYDPDTFKSIESSYDSNIDIAKFIISIFFVVFSGVDLILWIISFKTGFRSIRLYFIDKNGKEYNAKVTRISSFTRVNNSHRFCVYFTWVDENGTTRESYSQSKYSYSDALAFKRMGAVTIKAKNNYAVIVTKPNARNNKYDNDRYDYKGNQEYKNNGQLTDCRYCGNQVKTSEEYCKHCGAKIDKYK